MRHLLLLLPLVAVLVGAVATTELPGQELPTHQVTVPQTKTSGVKPPSERDRDRHRLAAMILLYVLTNHRLGN